MTIHQTPTDSGSGDRIRNAFEGNPRKMTVQLARELGVTELEVMRALPEKLVTELDITHWEDLIRGFEPIGQVHVIVTNGATTLEAFGKFGNFSRFGEYFNVQTSSIDMHLRPEELAAAFAVQKPGHMDGVNTLSFQFYDKRGAAAFKVFLSFGSKAASLDRVAAFEDLRSRHAMK